MNEEVTVGTPALIVVAGYKSYDCYDVKVDKVSPTGQITVNYIARGGYAVTKRFYKGKWNGSYRVVGGSSGYGGDSVSIYFGERAAKERAAVLEWREKQTIWEKLNVGLVNMPSSWGKSVPDNLAIAELRQKLAKVIGALNEAERYNNKQALVADAEKTDA